jgi:hypothetical protein
MPKVIKLTDAECKAIRTRYERGVPLEEMREEFGHSRTVLTKAVRRVGGEIRSRGRMVLPREVEPVFKNKLQMLSDLLEEKKQKEKGEPLNGEVLKTLVDYVLGFNDGRTFRKIDRRYDYEGTLSEFRKEHLEASYYVMGRLWRAVYRTVSFRNVNLAHYEVAEEDVQMCLDALTPENRKKIRSWVRKTKYVHLPNEEGVHKVVEACEKSMKSIVNSKLRFIYQYDPCYEREDLISFLRIVAYRVALKYDWEMLDGEFAYEKCLNYTKRSMWNAAFLLIKQNTSDDYRRLAKVDTDQRLYQITTISMDSPVDDEWLHIEKRLGEPEDRSIEVMDLARRIGKDEVRFFEYLRLEVEDVPEFTEFVLKETGQDENDLYVANYKEWRELALRFAGITKAEQRRAIKYRALKEIGLWDRSRVRKPEKERSSSNE